MGSALGGPCFLVFLPFLLDEPVVTILARALSRPVPIGCLLALSPARDTRVVLGQPVDALDPAVLQQDLATHTPLEGQFVCLADGMYLNRTLLHTDHDRIPGRFLHISHDRIPGRFLHIDQDRVLCGSSATSLITVGTEQREDPVVVAEERADVPAACGVWTNGHHACPAIPETVETVARTETRAALGAVLDGIRPVIVHTRACQWRRADSSFDLGHGELHHCYDRAGAATVVELGSRVGVKHWFLYGAVHLIFTHLHRVVNNNPHHTCQKGLENYNNNSPPIQQEMPDVPAILQNIPYKTHDMRVRNWWVRGTPHKDTRGHLSLFSFGQASGDLLLGWNGQLWALIPGLPCEHDMLLHRGRCKRHDPWAFLCGLRRLSADISWHPKELNYTSRDYEYWAGCHLFNKTGKRTFDVVHHGRMQNVNHFLIRLQRWTRRVVIARPRILALAMALHPRLGSDSALSLLGQDMLSLVITENKLNL